MAWSRVPTIRVPTDPVKLGYLAGLIDGEGCISVTMSRGRTREHNPGVRGYLSVANTDYRVMQWLLDNVGGRTIQKVDRANDAKGYKPVHHWALHGDNMELLLRAVLPHLIVKRERAELMLQLRGLGQFRGGRGTFVPAEVVAARQELVDRLKLWNRRGVA